MERDELMWKYIDGLCSEEEKAQVEAWKTESPEFTKELQLLSGIHTATADALVLEAPKGFTKSVTARLGKTFSFLPFITTSVSTRSIMPWAFGLGIIALFFGAMGFINTDLSATTGTDLPEVPGFLNNVKASTILWLVACGTFLAGIDRFLHYRFVKGEVKKSL